jgi:hypothetical protein
MQVMQICFGRGRSSFARGVLALFLAPVLAAFPVAGLMFFVSNHGLLPLPDLSMAIFRVTGLAGALLKSATLFALPTWLFLRLIRQEVGWAYAGLGFCEAMAAAIFFTTSFNGYFRADLTADFLLAGLVGAVIASLFWLIAKDPKEVVSKPPYT